LICLFFFFLLLLSLVFPSHTAESVDHTAARNINLQFTCVQARGPSHFPD
jgi:hypothetical protein